nr:GAF domain-containing sensor histidine kinase [uncultured Desulfobacter sp.]
MGKQTPEKRLAGMIDNLQTTSIIDHALIKKMKDAVEVFSSRGKELDALMNGAKTVLRQEGFLESARAIFDYCKDLIGATSGYVALLSDSGEENEVLFLEAGGLPCDVDPDLPMPIRGLRAQAYQTNSTVYHNDFMNSEWVDFMPGGHVVLNNVMFAPLVIEGKTVGIMGLANKMGAFTDNDAKMASGFGELAAIALQNSRNMDQRITAEKERERVIQELNQAIEKTRMRKSELETAYAKLTRMQTELVESKKMAALGNLIGGIAHEINTPVGVSITSISALLRKIEDSEKALVENQLSPEETADLIDYVNQSGNLVLKNLKRIVALVKSFKKISADTSGHELKRINLNTYLNEILNTMLPKLDRKKINIQIVCDETLELTTYPEALAQIIINLIMNSVIHGFSDTNQGNISIAADLDSNHLNIKFQDDGKGIAQSLLPKIFDPFVTSSKQKGFGLGLHIVYNLVKQTFDGSIRCESTEGCGTTFFVSLCTGSGEMSGN